MPLQKKFPLHRFPFLAAKRKWLYALMAIGVVAVAGFFLFSRPKASPPISESAPAPISVQVQPVGQRPEYSISEVATIKPLQEVEVLAKIGGEIDFLNLGLGQAVREGEVLASIDNSSNPAQINLNTLSSQLSSARQNYQEVVANSQDTQRKAELRAESLQDSVARLQRNLQELAQSNETRAKTLALQAENAQQSLANARLAAQKLETQFLQSWEAFFSSSQIAFQGFLVNAHSYHQTAAGIVNPNNVRPIGLDSFDKLLGIQSSAARSQAANAYNSMTALLEATGKAYEPLLPLAEENFAQAADLMEALVSAARSMNQSMRMLLDASQTSETLSSSMLEGFKAQVKAAEAGALGDANALSQVRQSRQSLELEQATQLATAQNNLIVAENQANDALASQNQFESTRASSIQDLENQLAQTRNELEAAQADAQSAARGVQLQESAKKLEISGYQNQVTLAQRALQDNQIASPIDGIVSEVLVARGDSVSPGSLVARVIQPDQVKAVFFVTEAQSAYLSAGQPVTIALADPEPPFQAKISRIAPSADPSNRKIRVEAEAPNLQTRLRPEMLVEVSIEVGPKAFDPNSLYVPLNSVIFGQNETYVFLAGAEGRAVKTPIELGQVLDKWVQVISGLAQGDSLIVEGQRRLEEGQAIQASSPNLKAPKPQPEN